MTAPLNMAFDFLAGQDPGDPFDIRMLSHDVFVDEFEQELGDEDRLRVIAVFLDAEDAQQEGQLEIALNLFSELREEPVFADSIVLNNNLACLCFQLKDVDQARTHLECASEGLAERTFFSRDPDSLRSAREAVETNRTVILG